MIRVLHVTRDYPPRINGGLSTAVGGLRRASASAIDSAVVSFDGWRPNRGRPALRLPVVADVCRVVEDADLNSAAAFAANQRPDVVHLHHAMLWDFAASLDRPVIFTVHVAQAALRRLRGLVESTASERAEEVALRGAAVVTAPSSSAAAAIDAPCRVLPLGVDAVTSPPAADPDPPRALYVGRFGDVKGTRELLAVIPKTSSALRWTVAGGLPDNPKADRRWRRRFAEEAPTAELTGWVSRGDLAALYRSASFVVVPSWYETFGQVILEAMQHGVPAIATEVGGLAELPAIHVAPRDERSLLAAVDALASDPVRRATARVQARSCAGEWTWSTRVDPWLGLYREIAR